jgi:hypothetical protein
MQYIIKHYESAKLFILLQNGQIIGMYNTFAEATMAKDSIELVEDDYIKI